MLDWLRRHLFSTAVLAAALAGAVFFSSPARVVPPNARAIGPAVQDAEPVGAKSEGRSGVPSADTRVNDPEIQPANPSDLEDEMSEARAAFFHRSARASLESAELEESSEGRRSESSASELRDYRRVLAALRTSASELPWTSSLRPFSELYEAGPTYGGAAARDDSRGLPDAELGVRYCRTIPDVQPEGLLKLAVTAGALPRGLSLLSAARQICGTPANTGIFRFTLRADYGINDQRFFSFRLVVREASAGSAESPLTITTLQLPVGAVGSNYAFQLSAVGGTEPYQWAASGLADGLELDVATGVIGGTPELDGSFGVLITVSDSEGATRSADLELLIRTSPVFITTGALEDGVLREFYQSQLGAQGGELPYRWEVLSALPPGLELDPISGVIRGEPEEEFAGTLQVRVTDSDENSDTAELPLRIRPTDLIIRTRALPEAFVGEPYKAVFEAEGGVPPYRWAIAGGALPAGVLFSAQGELGGTPVLTQETRFTVRVTDTAGVSDDQALNLRTVDVAPTPEEPETQPPVPSPVPTPGGGGTGGPEEPEEPQLLPVTGFQATPSDGKAGLVWTLPADPNLIRAIVVRSEAAAPESAEDGTVVYSGTAETFLDVDLTNGKTYFYAAFADYGSAGVSSGAAVSAFPQDVSVRGKPDTFIDSVVEFRPLDPECFNCGRMPGIVLGPPAGAGENTGSSDVVSINARINNDGGRTAPYGGTITLRFSDNLVVDGPGIDFVIFENAFRLIGTDLYWVEPAIVEVSADGKRFYRFPFDFVPHFDSNGILRLENPFSYPQGFAGVKPVYTANLTPDPTNPPLAGGDTFDLADLPGRPLTWIQYIRITSTGDAWMIDLNGDAVRHPSGAPTFAATGRGNSGFDLDAVTAVNF